MNFFVFYHERYDEKVKRGLAQEKQKEKEEKMQKEQDNDATISHNDSS